MVNIRVARDWCGKTPLWTKNHVKLKNSQRKTSFSGRPTYGNIGAIKFRRQSRGQPLSWRRAGMRCVPGSRCNYKLSRPVFLQESSSTWEPVFTGHRFPHAMITAKKQHRQTLSEYRANVCRRWHGIQTTFVSRVVLTATMVRLYFYLTVSEERKRVLET